MVSKVLVERNTTLKCSHKKEKEKLWSHFLQHCHSQCKKTSKLSFSLPIYHSPSSLCLWHNTSNWRRHAVLCSLGFLPDKRMSVWTRPQRPQVSSSAWIRICDIFPLHHILTHLIIDRWSREGQNMILNKNYIFELTYSTHAGCRPWTVRMISY